jgi:heterodisulfide reductase subunit B
MKPQALFLGCVIPLRFPGIELAARRVFGHLGVPCMDLQGYTCCPEPVVLGLTDRDLTTALSARNLALAEQAGADLLVLCNGCYETLVEAEHAWRHDAALRNRIAPLLEGSGRRYEGGVRVRHFVEFLHDEVGLDAIRAASRRGVEVSVALHYGCHLLRETGGGDPLRKAHMMRRLVEATGARVVDYGLERLCCGFPMSQFDKAAALEARILPKLRAVAGTAAEALVFCCPSCLNQCETGQDALSTRGAGGPYPCLYLLEWMALAFGAQPAELALESRTPLAREFAECFWA